MDKNLQEMTPAELTEEFRISSQKLGEQRVTTGSVEQKLSTRADLLEQEIQRRMAW